jgi:hypothetical protein
MLECGPEALGLILRSRVSGVSKDASGGSGTIWSILRDAGFARSSG